MSKNHTERLLESIRRSCLNCGHEHYNHNPCCSDIYCVSDLMRDHQKLKSELSQSIEREKKLRECVEFYGENPRWETGMSFDNGKQARQCLKQITELKEKEKCLNV